MTPEEQYKRMLGEFLTRMIDQHEPKIKAHIAGLEADRRELG